MGSGNCNDLLEDFGWEASDADFVRVDQYQPVLNMTRVEEILLRDHKDCVQGHEEILNFDRF